MNEKKIETAAALGNALVDRVDDFLHHFTKYPTDLLVGIHPETFDIILDSPTKEMKKASKNLEFERAAKLRDKIEELNNYILSL